ncbi:hypothetical protein TorRG33x02_194680 [Trema orientale]|uniref:Uncharacterized protein n=1 Tax=Trema orientale TaxID=63057 RepID=A0A2P5EGZ0_TREOI|nr:hypothetical protein TorRG33x02_194680 [Trema orientale]
MADFDTVEESGTVVNAVEGSGFELVSFTVGVIGTGAGCMAVKAALCCDVLGGDGGFGIGSKADFNTVEKSLSVVNAVEGSGCELELPTTGVFGSVGAGAECMTIKAVLGCDVLSGDSGFGIGSRADFNTVEESGDVVNGVEGSGFELELLLVVVFGGVGAGVECTAIIAVLGDDVLGGKGDGFGGPVVSLTGGVEDNANAEDGADGVFNG